MKKSFKEITTYSNRSSGEWAPINHYYIVILARPTLQHLNPKYCSHHHLTARLVSSWICVVCVRYCLLSNSDVRIVGIKWLLALPPHACYHSDKLPISFIYAWGTGRPLENGSADALKASKKGTTVACIPASPVCFTSLHPCWAGPLSVQYCYNISNNKID